MRSFISILVNDPKYILSNSGLWEELINEGFCERDNLELDIFVPNLTLIEKKLLHRVIVLIFLEVTC